MQVYLDEFILHNEIIEQFGRDPTRNVILERESTEEEQAYM